MPDASRRGVPVRTRKEYKNALGAKVTAYTRIENVDKKVCRRRKSRTAIERPVQITMPSRKLRMAFSFRAATRLADALACRWAVRTAIFQV